MGRIQLRTKIPGPRSLALMDRRKEAVARGPFHTTPLFVTKAHGAVLEDVDGNHFLDFACGIGVTNLGHTPQGIIEAVTTQAQLLHHSSFNVAPYENYVAVAEKLNQLAPGQSKKKTFLANSGAEAVENAIKIARTFTKRRPIIAFEHAFHGRTYMAMNLTYKEKPYKEGFGPFNNEVYRSPFPYCYRWPGTSNETLVSQECLERFESLIGTLPEKPAAVIIEPVLGEGGFIPAPKEFLHGLSQYCRKEGIIFIADEIQTGFGRTGTLFASEQVDLEPDLICMAKGLAGGFPLSAVTGRAEIMDSVTEGGIGGTFGGNPVACSAALAVIDEMTRENVLRGFRQLGEKIAYKLNQFKEKFELIGDVRGLGPMMALEIVKNRQTKDPYPEACKALVRQCYENGLVIMTSGSLGNVVRLLVPLTLDDADLDEGFQVLENGLRELSS